MPSEPPVTRRLLLGIVSACLLAPGAGLAQTSLVCSADGGTGCNQTIPDDDPNGVESSLEASSSCDFGREIDVGVDLHHTWVGDLVVTLTHESTGTSVDLLDRFQSGGCNGDDVDALFSNGAAAPVCSNAVIPTVHGTVIPAETLLPFRTENASGTWTLTVVDAAANETGELFDWDLTVTCVPPGITVFPTAGLTTTESGGTDQFEVVLDTVPTGDVTVALSSLDPSEGTVSPSTLTFTPGNALVPQTVTVTGVDDAVADGDVLYVVHLEPATSSDSSYDGLVPDDVSVTNLDEGGDTVPIPTLSEWALWLMILLLAAAGVRWAR